MFFKNFIGYNSLKKLSWRSWKIALNDSLEAPLLISLIESISMLNWLKSSFTYRTISEVVGKVFEFVSYFLLYSTAFWKTSSMSERSLKI